MPTWCAVQSGWDVSAVNTRGGLARDRLAILESPRRLPAGRLLLQGVLQQALVPALGAHVPHDLHGSRARWICEAPRRSTPKRYDFCDVLVVGAGPSGLAAALAAAERGAVGAARR